MITNYIKPLSVLFINLIALSLTLYALSLVPVANGIDIHSCADRCEENDIARR